MEATNEVQVEKEHSLAEKFLLIIFILLVVGSVGYTYWKIMIKRDYVIVAQDYLNCDPYAEKCFVHVCNPSPDVDGPESCTGNPEEDTWYFRNVSRMAYNIPDCDPNDENCTALICNEGEAGCYYEYCNESNVSEGDVCNDPVRYAIDNPVEEECNPEEDEECEIDEKCDPESGDCPDASGAESVEAENGDDSLSATNENSTASDTNPVTPCVNDVGVCPIGG